MSAKQRLGCPFCSHVVEAHPGRAKWALAVHTWPRSVATPEERTAWYLSRRWTKRVTLAAKEAQARRARVLDRYAVEIVAATERGFTDTAERIAVERDDFVARGEGAATRPHKGDRPGSAGEAAAGAWGEDRCVTATVIASREGQPVTARRVGQGASSSRARRVDVAP